MIQFFYHPSPNPAKVALLLEETGLPYEVRPVDTRKGEQFDPSFLAINPNAKTPALVAVSQRWMARCQVPTPGKLRPRAVLETEH